MKKRYVKSVFFMELCCLGYLFFQVLFALSRKGPSGVAALVNNFLPFNCLQAGITKMVETIPVWIYSSWGIGSYYGLIIILFFLVYWGAFRVFWKNICSLRFLILSASLFCFTLFFFAPGKHADIFLYIFQGKMVAFYGANPYFVRPAVFAGDNLLRFVGWQEFTSSYGPVWHLFSAVLYRLGKDNIILEIGIFRFFIILCHIANVYLIYHILRIIKPEFKNTGTFLYAWNPLALIFASAGSTNDFLMLTFLLLGLYLYLKKEIFMPAVCFALAAFTKFSYILFFPLYLKILKTKKQMFFSLIAFSIVSVLIWIPFYEGPRSLLKPFWMTGALSHSFLFLFNFVLSSAAGQTTAAMATQMVKLVFHLLFLGLFMFVFIKVRSVQAVLNSCAMLFFFLVTCIMPTWATWYVLWCIPFAVLSCVPEIILTCIVFSFSALFSLAIYYFFHSYAPGYQILTLLMALPLPLFIAVKTKIWRHIRNETISDNSGV